MTCVSCGTQLNPENVFCDLGHQPLANALLTAVDLARPEVTYPLRAVVCSECMLAQLPACPSADTIFTASYPFYSGQSGAWVQHCEQYVRMAVERFALDRASRVLEIGSNDGVMLRAFQLAGIPATGVEPSREVAEFAIRSGAASYIAPWGVQLASHLAEDGWRADLIVANNVLAHVEDLHDFLRGVWTVLSDDGTVTIEVPYVSDMIDAGAYDQVYAEHRCYFSVRSLSRALDRSGLLIWGVERIPTHGGSVRVYARRDDGVTPEGWRPSDVRPIDETAADLGRMGTYRAFALRPAASKTQGMRELCEVHGTGARIAGYGASAKTTVTLNWLGWGPEVIPFTVDTTPVKQGRYIPGVHVPIVAADDAPRNVDVVFNFLWNWREQSERNIRSLWPEARIIYPHDFA